MSVTLVQTWPCPPSLLRSSLRVPCRRPNLGPLSQVRHPVPRGHGARAGGVHRCVAAAAVRADGADAAAAHDGRATDLRNPPLRRLRRAARLHPRRARLQLLPRPAGRPRRGHIWERGPSEIRARSERDPSELRVSCE
eukprot:1688434-Pleurochrysis_carterae.AAC.1